MRDASDDQMAAWCEAHGLRWHAFTPLQAARARHLAGHPMRLLPERLQGGLVRWIVRGIPPGSFLMAVLRNDLADACARADDDMRPLIADVVKWLYNYAPRSGWGAPDRAADWPAEAER